MERDRTLEVHGRTCNLWVDMIAAAFAAQAIVDNGVVAGALELYFLDEGRYPAHLEELVSQFVGQLSADIVGGESLCYILQVDGRPAIWSIGANREDDGGLPRKNLSLGDWVWQCSTP